MLTPFNYPCIFCSQQIKQLSNNTYLCKNHNLEIRYDFFNFKIIKIVIAKELVRIIAFPKDSASNIFKNKAFIDIMDNHVFVSYREIASYDYLWFENKTFEEIEKKLNSFNNLKSFF